MEHTISKIVTITHRLGVWTDSQDEWDYVVDWCWLLGMDYPGMLA